MAGKSFLLSMEGCIESPVTVAKPTPLAQGGQFGSFPSISREGNRLVYSEQSYRRGHLANRSASARR